VLRFLRYLRIAFSATCLIACVLLIVLWVRSYSSEDYLYWNIVGHRTVLVGSTHGRLVAYTALFESKPGARFRLLDKVGIALATRWTEVERLLSCDSYSPILAANYRALVVSHWIMVLVTGTLAAMLGLRRPYRLRFSLRTLLIAMTLVAVVLGLAVWAART
jgi:hypothetical protein